MCAMACPAAFPFFRGGVLPPMFHAFAELP